MEIGHSGIEPRLISWPLLSPSFCAIPLGAQDHSQGTGGFRQEAQDEFAALEECQAGALDRQPAVVAINRQAREAVAFTRNQTIGGQIAAERQGLLRIVPLPRSRPTRTLHPGGLGPSDRA